MDDTRLKYILTKIDNEPHVLCVTKCNFCPFFSLESTGFSCFCHHSEVNNGRFITKVNSVVYSTGYRYTVVDIQKPEWCKLNELLVGGELDNTMYYRTGEHTISCEKIESVDNCPVIFDTDVKRSKDGLKKDTKKINERELKRISEYNKNICSCCGSKRKEVDRKKNMGMCNECFDMVTRNNDDETIRFIFMNNFRLKRKSTYSNMKFKKIIDNNNYYDKNFV